jgi:hypothetical protein
MALIDLTDFQSGKRLAALTKDLSRFGCCVKTATPFPDGIKVRLRIWHAGMNFVARGRVAHSRPDSGMGIAFITIEPGSMPILDTWLRYLGK